ncbi:MAG: aspartate aminotransferase family protein [Phycisphaerae bacterium]|nr:aspartate aminotransferase family protein [Phycisphaerae bacterium]
MSNHNSTPSPDVTEGDVNVSAARTRWHADRAAHSDTALLERDLAAFFRQSLSTPCLGALRSAHGSRIEDTSGRTYLDFHGNNVHHVGYGHPKVVEAVSRQLTSLPFCPRRFTNEPAVVLAERLSHLAPPGLSKVLFAPGGATAIGIALKIARLATGRYKTLAFTDSFHGASLEASSLGGESLFREGFGPLLPGAYLIDPPAISGCRYGCGGRCTQRCAEAVEQMLDRIGDVAALIAEPIRCTTVLVPPRDYWPRIKDACSKNGTLLIFDEIPTGLGRTGDLFASQTVGVTPDILVLGKALGGAVMPAAAVLARPELDVAPHKSIGHYTHEKSPVAAAAALATLDIILGENLPARARDLGAYMLTRLRTLAGRVPIIGEVRGVGLLIGVEVVKDTRTRTPNPTAAEAILYRCLADGLSFKVSAGHVLTLTPPLTIERADLDRALDILEHHLLLVNGS